MPTYLETKSKIYKQPTGNTMYFTGRTVPEIMELIDAAINIEDQIRVIAAYSTDPTFVAMMDLWINGEFPDYSHVEFATHTLPNGMAPQTLSNNIPRIKMLLKSNPLPAAGKDKIFSNILQSVNQNEIDFLVAMVKDEMHEIYLAVSKKTILAGLPQLKDNNAST